MLFNSFEFIFAFLPLSILVYFFLNHKRLVIASKSWLIVCSLFFYSWWNVLYLPLILISMIINYAIGSSLAQADKQIRIERKILLAVGILFNVGLLSYFKYADFFIENFNALFSSGIGLLHLALPLAISFFTFQQIAYLVDSYRRETSEYDFLNYALFVTFFPQLIAGPIVHHKEMMPQFETVRNKVLNYKNLYVGIFIFSMGLFKKVVIADTFAQWANVGFDRAEVLTFVEAWATSLSYTFQLYFDFSGYTDMAIGAALLFNIRLPLNFNSPYKALDIQDFWRRWHITLSRFLRDYIYIPLGGNRLGSFRTYNNLMITFLIGGLWHGAGWTFVFWGFLHGFALVIHRIWKQLSFFTLPRILAWLITFNFVNIAWVFFRAREWDDAIKVLKGMFGLEGFVISYTLAEDMPRLLEWGAVAGNHLKNLHANDDVIRMIVIATIFIFLKNSMEYAKVLKPRLLHFLITVVILVWSTTMMYRVNEFLYFNF